jgi:hypothetical protein
MLLFAFVAARRKLKDQRGAVALMTLGYLITCGLICLLTLWGIANATGAYNALYGVTQSAAYAAASATESPAGTSDSLTFQCGGTPSPSGDCTSGEAFTAAQDAAVTGLSSGVPGRFGLVYGANASLTDSNGNAANIIYAYSPAGTPAENQDFFAKTGKCTQVNPDTGAVILACWRLQDSVASTANFEPGTAVYMRADIPLCMSSICPSITLRTAAAATVSQPNR